MSKDSGDVIQNTGSQKWLYLFLGVLLGTGITLLVLQFTGGGSFLQGYLSPATLKSVTNIRSFDPEPEPPGYVALPTSR